ncbi:MAG: putative zinc-binding metallopeptidase [Muribaculaceae bacterium]
MNIRKYILRITLLAVVTLALGGCNNDDLDPNSIFDTEDTELDPTLASYKFDKWLLTNFQGVYNLQFRYKMQDVGADMDYNLVPATYDRSIDLAVLTKYLWFDAYATAVNPDFLKYYGPRIIHLIGSPAYNPANHTMILGLAEGGLKVSLFRVNSIDPSDFVMLNEFYFKTMHHEFAHILHQTKTYPKEFDQISSKYYEPFNWQDRDYRVVASLGFTSPYASSQAREDYAETIANFITMTQEQWNMLLDMASKGWTPILDPDGKQSYVEGPDLDGVDGKATILQKVSIARQWFRDAWSIDLDKLRAEVQTRQKNFDIKALREEVNQVK